MADNMDPNTTPVVMPPPGVIPNFTDPYNPMETTLIVTLTLCPLFLIVFVALRCFTRFYIIKKTEATDYLIIFACIAVLTFIAMSINNISFGAGRHTWDMSITQMIQYQYHFNILAIVYCVMIVPAKASVIVPLITTFTPKNKTWLYWSYVILLSLHVAVSLSTMFALIFLCTPREKIWNPSLPGKCVDLLSLFIYNGVWNVIVDSCITILPMFSIWHLHLPTKYKVGVSIMFLTTVFALVASVARLGYTFAISETTDLVYVATKFGLWSNAEMVLLVCCSCMPVFPRLYRWLHGHVRPKKSEQIEFGRHGRRQDTILTTKNFESGTSAQVLVGTKVSIASEPRSNLDMHESDQDQYMATVHISGD